MVVRRSCWAAVQHNAPKKKPRQKRSPAADVARGFQVYKEENAPEMRKSSFGLKTFKFR
jgi:hypothetical protein